MERRRKGEAAAKWVISEKNPEDLILLSNFSIAGIIK